MKESKGKPKKVAPKQNASQPSLKTPAGAPAQKPSGGRG